MKTPQILVTRLESITSKENASHLANIIELAFNNRLKDDFDVKVHISNVLLTNKIDTVNFEFKTVIKPISRKLTEETRKKRFLEQIKKQSEKYGISISSINFKESE